MIDELLHRFGHLGVSTATPRPLDDTVRPVEPDLLSTQQLKERGWTRTMIERLLPRPDDTRANQLEVGWARRRLTAPVKLYRLARVEEAELSDDYLIAQATAEKCRATQRKAAATREALFQRLLAGYGPALTVEPSGQLQGNTFWRYHLTELDRYETSIDAEARRLPARQQKRLRTELYEKHRAAFRARFGSEY